METVISGTNLPEEEFFQNVQLTSHCNLNVDTQKEQNTSVE